MGVVARQGFKSGIVTYVGIALGVINNMILYPYLLEVSEYGVIQFVIQSASFFTPFLLLGFTNVLLKYYPFYSDNKSSKNYLFSLVFGIVILTSLALVLIFLSFKDSILSYYQNDIDVSNVAIYVMLGISIILPFNIMFQKFASIYERIAVPSLYNQLYKFIAPFIVLGYFFKLYSFDMALWAILLFYIGLFLLNRNYVLKLDRFKLINPYKMFKADARRKKILEFAGFGIFTSIAGTFATQIDILMITSMKGTYETGIYAWALFGISAVVVPYRLIDGITTPIIARHWKENKHQQIEKIYKQSSSSLLFICLGLFLAFWIILNDLFLIMPKGGSYRDAKMVVLFLGIAKLIDVGAGLNSQILAMSDQFRKVLYFILTSATVNVVLNIVLIPKYGVEGSAMATIASLLVFNLLKFCFIYWKFKIQPFTWKSLVTIVLGISLLFLVQWIPKTGSPIINILMYGSIFTLSYFALGYKFHLAQDLNNFVNKQLARFGIRSFD